MPFIRPREFYLKTFTANTISNRNWSSIYAGFKNLRFQFELHLIYIFWRIQFTKFPMVLLILPLRKMLLEFRIVAIGYKYVEYKYVFCNLIRKVDRNESYRRAVLLYALKELKLQKSHAL